MAFVMRARVRVWWHLKRQQVQLAILDGRAVHFRSFAELSVCGCAPSPDLHGVTSGLMRLLLSRFTAEHPLEIDLPTGDAGGGGGGAEGEAADGGEGGKRTKGELRWTSGLTRITYRVPL